MNCEIRIALDEVLKEKGKTRYWLSKQTKIPYKTINNYYYNKLKGYTSTSIAKMCIALNCQVGDIIKIVRTK